MFSNRAFYTTFIISLTWHVVCLSTVNIVVLPGRYKARKLTSVSFLGPILEKTALEIILANKPVAVTTSYQRDLKYMHNVGEKEWMPLRDGAKNHIDINTKDKIERALSKTVAGDKEIPNIVTTSSSRSTYFMDSKEVSGPISGREVIYKPEEPELPTWIKANSSFKMELEFIVSAQGEVKRVVPVVSCGDPEVDLLGIRYLKSWRFVPLAQNMDAEQKGRIKFVFGGS